MVQTDNSGQFTENKGVTMESGFPIKPVSAPPTEPAGQPTSAAPSSDMGGAQTSED
ncbi:hypothetical protein [Actinophytocola algeriensis]|uniref:Uncharacterized protein n=1 Tax=Actinophytocola algeriensis TaxID=1768010 RepID=A0A7W7QC70_9PSEU|nr:hypothetical protein [Actinophytocola algeriensis]MBB4910594.1 hypothetical protein [Actinophytocola algeriensis]MBE1480418.1 hypothetical protein [Actinophytocola algeriensis]